MYEYDTSEGSAIYIGPQGQDDCRRVEYVLPCGHSRSGRGESSVRMGC